MEQIKLTINGQEISAAPGKTILEVVEENKLDTIPTLCHDKRIEHFTSCFLCVVEAEGMNKLLPACSTPISAGMKLQTRSQKVEESRKTALELLMSNHYADCVGPCRNNCPAGVDAQAYIALVSMGKHKEAIKLIKENNPLPLSIGRVCVRDCETACRRKYVDEPVAVNALKRYVADLDMVDMWTPEIKEKKNRKVAVIGGGPSGLACAYYLTIEGYSVTILERLPELGGMLRYGIPEYRLPKNILDKEIKWITDLGVEVKTGVESGKDFTIKELRESYDAVFVGVGAHKASKMGLEGEDTTIGIYKGIDFLRELEMVKIPQLNGTVLIVGGGNTAIDAARTALRCGADKVKIVYRRSLNEMPAAKEEIHAAQEEGIEILFLTLPVRIISGNNTLKAIECQKMELVPGKPGERPRPVPVQGSEFILQADYVIGAIGQAVETSFSKHDTEIQLEKWGTVKVNNDTMETLLPGVFAGGDVVTGPFTAITSIAQGKKAAHSIMSFLEKGKAEKAPQKFYSFKHKLSTLSEKEFDHIKKLAREKMKELEVTDRIHTFQEVECGVSEDQTTKESFRCLECGCSEYYDCTLRQYCDEYQVDITGTAGEIRKYIPDLRHPFISLDPNKCINCGKCVRTCTEILKISALGFVNRGFRSIVKPAMEKALLETNCISCGNCIDVCPTGAISEKYTFKTFGTLPKENVETICNFCSVGCKVNFKKISDSIFYIANTTQEIQDSHNRGYLCSKGRFGYRYLLEKNRVQSPRIRRHGLTEHVTVNEALDYTAKRVKEIMAKHGSDAVAVFASPRLSNEEMYLLQKLTRTGLKNNNITSFTDMVYGKERDSLDEIAGFTSSTVAMEELEKADVIVVVNSNMSEENLVMELKIKNAQKNGCKVILINSSEVRLTKAADLWIDSKKGTSTLLLNAVIKKIISSGKFGTEYINKRTEGFSRLREMLEGIEVNEAVEIAGLETSKFELLTEILADKNLNVVFTYNIDSNSDRSNECLKAIGNYLLLTDRLGRKSNGLLLLREYSNSTGLYELGASPEYLPGFIKQADKDEVERIGKFWKSDIRSIFKPAELIKKFRKGEIKALLIFGEDPLADENSRKYLNSVEFIAAVDAFHTNTTEEADVVIPASTYIEQEGTYTRCDGVVQRSNKVINSPHSRSNIQVISRLGSCFTEHFYYESYDEVSAEIRRLSRLYKYSEPGTEWVSSYFSNGFSTMRHSFAEYKIDFTTSEPAKPAVHYQDNYYLSNVKKKLT